MNRENDAKECSKMRENEVFISRLENQLHRADNVLDALVFKVAPVTLERPANMQQIQSNCADVRSPLLTELYKQSSRLDQIINRLEYIMESVEI